MAIKWSHLANLSVVITSFILAITTFAIGLVIATYASNYHLTFDYKPSSCTLRTSSVITIGCVSDYYVGVWQDANGRTVLESPLSATRNKAYASSKMGNYPLNVPIECVCRATPILTYPHIQQVVPCDVYGQCFLNVQLLSFMLGQQYLFNVGVALIIKGIAGLVILIILIVIRYRLHRRDNYQEMTNV